MKYLNTYKLFESKKLSPSLKDEIRDILFEVEDMDYQVEYKYEIDKWNPYPSIRINPKSDNVNEDPNLSPGSPAKGEFIEKVYLPDIEDAIDRLKEVCKQRGYHVSMSVQTPTAKTWMENGELKYKTHPPKTYNWIELKLR